jgi:hypothetical protein
VAEYFAKALPRFPLATSPQSSRYFRSSKSQTKREVKGLNARVKEFDLEGSVYDWTFLPDELIESHPEQCQLRNFSRERRRPRSHGAFVSE